MKKNKKENKDLTVLIAPLDWGLGHATRCIPIINSLLRHNVKVLVCGNGAIENLLLQEFPNIEILPLKGYDIKYSKNGKSFLLNILFQLPKILFTVVYENQWLRRVIKKYDIDAVISDNRLGCFNKKIPSVFITHQLNIKTGHSFVDKIVRRINYFFINHYDECWVPDEASENNLAGALSHPRQTPNKPVKHIGILSRFTKIDCELKYKACILLSGPEPQRTMLENKIIQELKHFDEPVVIVRGVPGEKTVLKNLSNNLTQYNHLKASDLCTIIQQSQIIVSRAGYSTIMDLMALEQNAILIPTPGQTEQEYLGTYLHEKQLCFTVSQDDFNLVTAIEQLKNINFKKNRFSEKYQETLLGWISRIKTQH